MFCFKNQSYKSNRLTVENNAQYLDCNLKITNIQLNFSKSLMNEVVNLHRDIYFSKGLDGKIYDSKVEYFSNLEKKLKNMITEISSVFDEWTEQLDRYLISFSEINQKLLFFFNNEELMNNLENRYVYHYYKEIPSYNSFFSDMKLNLSQLTQYGNTICGVFVALNQSNPILPFNSSNEQIIQNWVSTKKNQFNITDIKLIRENLFSLSGSIKTLKNQIIDYLLTFTSSIQSLSKINDCLNHPITCRINSFISPLINHLKAVYVMAFNIINDYEPILTNVVLEIKERW